MIRRHKSSSSQYDEVYKRSIGNPEEFWAEISQNVHWFKPWDKVLDTSSSPAQKWYVDSVVVHEGPMVKLGR